MIRKQIEQVDEVLEDRLYHPFKKLSHYLLMALAASVFFNLLFWSSAYDTVRGGVIATFWSASHWFAQSLGNGYLSGLIDRRYSWLEKPWTRVLVGFGTLVAYSVIAYLIVQLVFLYFWSGRIPSDLWSFAITNAKVAVGISFTIAFIFTTIGFFRNWKKSAIEAERLQTEMMTYKYESLRNQINPHFLFNSLNTLTELVHEDPDVAVKFIRQLSDLYRYVLDSREREVVSLSEELDFIHSFAYLLKTRFEHKLDILVDVQSEPSEMIVPMALQSLLENAVKHNEVSTMNPLKVTVTRDEGRLIVQNAILKKHVGDDSKGTGIQNIISRYEFLSDEQVKIDDSNGQFVVSLPILKMEKT